MADILTGSDVGAWVRDTQAPAPELDMIASVASALVLRMIADLEAETVPANVHKLAALDLAADLWDQRTAPNGVRMFADGMDGAVPVRVRADATARARRLLAGWLPPTID